MKEVITTNSAEETEKTAEEFSAKLSAGSVVALTGDLGAGKTAFTKGLARGLGITEHIKSPSFTIVNIYDKSFGGRLELYHADLYRIENKLELTDLGLDEYVYGKGVTVIEWAERIADELPKDTYRVNIEYKDETEREITIESN